MEDWLARWREGRIGFHEGQVNALLDAHAARLAGARRVLVPLCGRAEDLAYLAARGHEIVGVELAEQAVREFFERHGLVPEVEPRGALTAYRAGAITILAGDFFAVRREDVGAIGGLYDRAALIALEAEVRPRYVAHLRTLLAEDARGIVLTCEYQDARVHGPPFPVLEDELRALYAGAEVAWLEDRPFASPRFVELGVHATERAFLVSDPGARSARGTP